MELLQTAALVRVHYLPSCASTNDAIKAFLTEQPPSLPLLLVTAHQTAGRGRRERTWITPPGSALATSLYIPAWPSDRSSVSWAALLAGVAISQALQNWVPAFVKWPNDVLVELPEASTDALAKARGGAKLCGILCEKTALDGVIIGAGINIFATTDPPAGAISLQQAARALGNRFVPESFADSAGVALADELLSRYVARVLQGVQMASADPQAFQATLERGIKTVQQRVLVQLPSEREIHGYAVGLGAAGELLVRDARGQTHTVASADVAHLRLN